MRSKDIKTDGTVYAWVEPHSHGAVWPVTIAATGKDFRTRKVQVGIGLGDVTGGKQRQDGVEATIIEGGGSSFATGRGRVPGYTETFSAREIASTWEDYLAQQQEEKEREEQARQRKNEQRERGSRIAARLTEMGVRGALVSGDSIRITPHGLDDLEALLDRLDAKG